MEWQCKIVSGSEWFDGIARSSEWEGGRPGGRVSAMTDGWYGCVTGSRWVRCVRVGAGGV